MTIRKNLLVLAAMAGALLLAGCAANEETTETASILPPKYLEVSEFQSCLGTMQVASHEQWCLPEAQPENCPTESWDELNGFTGGDRLPSCE